MPIPSGFSSMPTIEANVPALDATNCISSLASKVNYVTKTASYTCTRADSGTHFSNLAAAGAVTFTLPAVATSAGCVYWFHTAVAAQNLLVTAPAGTLVAYNNAAATTISLVTAGNIAGACIHAFCTGTKWIAAVRLENIGVTITVA
jgi:hypothetical protein